MPSRRYCRQVPSSRYGLSLSSRYLRFWISSDTLSEGDRGLTKVSALDACRSARMQCEHIEEVFILAPRTDDRQLLSSHAMRAKAREIKLHVTENRARHHWRLAKRTAYVNVALSVWLVVMFAPFAATPRWPSCFKKRLRLADFQLPAF